MLMLTLLTIPLTLAVLLLTTTQAAEFLIVGSGDTLASDDGANWTRRAGPPPPYAGTSARHSGDVWVLTSGTGASLYWSRDAENWTRATPDPFASGCSKAEYDSAARRWVALGPGVVFETVAESFDGRSWKILAVGGSSFFDSGGSDIAWSPSLGRRVIVSAAPQMIAGDPYAIGVSADVAWSLLATASLWGNGGGRSIERSETLGIFVAGGVAPNTLAYSRDGVIWEGLGASVFSTEVRDVAYAEAAGQDARWVAVGSGTNSIAYSDDGVAWTGLGTAVFSTGLSVAYSSTAQAWVALGDTHIARSPDGVTWTQVAANDVDGKAVATAATAALSTSAVLTALPSTSSSSLSTSALSTSTSSPSAVVTSTSSTSTLLTSSTSTSLWITVTIALLAAVALLTIVLVAFGVVLWKMHSWSRDDVDSCAVNNEVNNVDSDVDSAAVDRAAVNANYGSVADFADDSTAVNDSKIIYNSI